MIIIPAIDIKGGKCVRLEQGRMDCETIYSEDPVKVAKRWQEGGAEIIHIVDLDAACEGRPVNHEIIKSIAEAVDVPLQVGGGIRDIDSAEAYLSLNQIKRVVVGTAAIKDESFLHLLIEKHPGRVAVGIDAKDGKVAIRGWVDVTDTEAFELAQKLEGTGAACIIYTDISRDGMLAGPNIEATKKLADSISIPVVASGGVSKIEDITALTRTGVQAAIVGKALYSGAVELEEAIVQGSQTSA